VPRRSIPLNGGVPDFSWLYRYPKRFAERPHGYTRRCSWCGEAFWILKNMIRVCPKCDMAEGQ
jgi:hypothetical protein